VYLNWDSGVFELCFLGKSSIHGAGISCGEAVMVVVVMLAHQIMTLTVR
jgi:hypothetical protein